jgi:hypothetical protein
MSSNRRLATRTPQTPISTTHEPKRVNKGPNETAEAVRTRTAEDRTQPAGRAVASGKKQEK